MERLKKGNSFKKIPVREGIFTAETNISEPFLIASKCKRCGLYVFPAKKICSKCFGDEMNEERVKGVGTIYTFAIVRQAPSGFSVPYATVYVDLPEGIRVFGQCDLSSWKNGIPKIGHRVELTLQPVKKDSKGNEHIGMVFCRA